MQGVQMPLVKLKFTLNFSACMETNTTRTRYKTAYQSLRLRSLAISPLLPAQHIFQSFLRLF